MVLRTAVAPRFSSRGLWPRLMVAPLIIGLTIFAVYPLIYLVFLSASKSALGRTFQAWVGLGNYRTALEDTVFTQALVRSVVFAVPVTAIEVLAGVGIAVLLSNTRRGGNVFRTLILLPLMTPPIMVATSWKLIFHPTGGLLNGVLQSLGLTDRPISFLGSSRWAFPAIAVADFWQWTPFVILLAYASLQTLPSEVQEAALVDGASGVRAFVSVTLPLLGPALAAIFLLRVILAFKVFDLVYSLTFGGPGFDTNIGTFQIFRMAFRQFDVGYAAAQTIVFGLLVGVVTLPIVIARNAMIRHWT
ncbi:MAG TPA: sugar ABC transporter permease [Thermomicrobiales bacterium]